MNEAKRMGRPPKPDAEKRQQIGVRVSPELKERLELSAGANGRSVAQEAEFRLAESHDLEAILGAPRTKSLMIELAGQISRAEAATGKSWHLDQATHRAAAVLIEHAVNTARPLPENAQDAIELSNRLSANFDRKSLLTQFLLDCGAIANTQGVLAALVDPKPVYRVTEEAGWHRPNAPDPLSAEDLNALREIISEWSSLDEAGAQIFLEMSDAMEPRVRAKREGEAIAASILGGDKAVVNALLRHGG